MNAADAGILMLTCPLGQADAQVLTPQQFAQTAKIVRARHVDGGDPTEELTVSALEALGFTMENSGRLVALLTRERELSDYLARAEQRGVFWLTVRAADYPASLRKLRGSMPPVLFGRGDRKLLSSKKIALVGSRRLESAPRKFAERIGFLSAKEGFTLVSGGAAGADSAAQDACLDAGGSVIVVTPKRLTEEVLRPRMLILSESGWDLEFTNHRALARNRLIHALGEKTFVAQCANGVGGTWHGSAENLRARLSPLFVYDDGSDGAQALLDLGATPVGMLRSLADAAPAGLV
ncbi:MAG: DNA-processing protein DprA [Oscillospiraceae bacterium]|nr:DNA-processing protein DprA [Oscillospiraceae bacterium]